MRLTKRGKEVFTMPACTVFTSQKVLRGLKIMRNIHLVILLSVCFFTSMFLTGTGVNAATINAASCERAEVQAAVDTAQRGDTVVVPPGICKWGTTVWVTKSIAIQGAGIGVTTIIAGFQSPSAALIKFNFPNGGRVDATVPVRVTGFTFDMARKSMGIWINYQSLTPLENMRIHNNSFINTPTDPRIAGYYTLRLAGNIYGVVDNNTFVGSPCSMVTGYGWDVISNYSWENERFAYGNNKTIFFEDNTYTETNLLPEGSTFVVNWGQLFASGFGGKYVVRYNTINQNYNTWRMLFDIHGQGVGYDASIGLEAYGNRVSMLYNSGLGVTDCRGGMTLAFYNRVFGDSSNIENAIREQETDTKSPTTNPCPAGTLYATTPKQPIKSCSPSGQPQHVSSSYFWNNRKGTGTGSLIRAVYNKSGWVDGLDLRENTDYWQDNANCTGSACTTGVGCGATLPTSCTTGTGYWLTSQSCSEVPTTSVGINPTIPITGTLYLCGPKKTWQPYYTPYTYPHPLRGGEVETLRAPKGFKVVS